jgi:single-stranded-DNA-specific exonuclease
MNAKRWIVREQNAPRVASLARALNVSPTIASLLLSRGCDDPESGRHFLKPSYDQLHDPYLMLGMSKAVPRLLQAIEQGERILIYGDYDVDGTTGTAVLLRALGMLGAKTGFHVPHRFTEGYGIQQAALQKAFEEGYKLAISVDCGIRAHEPLYWARDNGLDVIITDHHLPDEGEQGVPPAYAILNPNQIDCTYPDKNLAGVGVAFKLVHALFREYGREAQVEGFLKVVAIGTVADVAKLTGENRTIVALGLKDLPRATNPGLRALMEVAGCDATSMTAYDIGFRLGPRINAAGRMDAARAVVDLFSTRDVAEAKRLALHLDTRNRERKEVQQQIINLAISELESGGADSHSSHVAVIAGDGWHRGVIGIAASKIVERINRPCVVLSIEGDVAHGSGRSIEPYHLLNGLTSCADLFEKFGGHSHAAGITIKPDRIDDFRQRLNAHAASCLTDEDLLPCVYIDAELPAQEISFELVGELQTLEPFGAGNPRPVFLARNLCIVSEPRLIGQRHVKFSVAGPQGRPLETIWWGAADSLADLRNGIDMAYTIETSNWTGETFLQLSVQDIRKSSQQPANSKQPESREQ